MDKKTKVIIALLICILLIPMIFNKTNGGKQKDTANQQSEEEVEETTENNKEEKELTLQLSNGTFVVGKDLEPGTYILIKNEGEYMGSYDITTDTTGDISSNVDSNAFENFNYIEVKNKQYVQLDKCTLYKVDEIKPYIGIDDMKELTNGMYIVGEDIKPGEYKLEVIDENGQGWYSLYNNLAGGYKNGPDLQSSDFFSGSKLITLKKGQYLKLDSNTKITK